ncbi:hypothetical protein BVY03_00415, partial [bacterium K02(2017)]
MVVAIQPSVLSGNPVTASILPSQPGLSSLTPLIPQPQFGPVATIKKAALNGMAGVRQFAGKTAHGINSYLMDQHGIDLRVAGSYFTKATQASELSKNIYLSEGIDSTTSKETSESELDAIKDLENQGRLNQEPKEPKKGLIKRLFEQTIARQDRAIFVTTIMGALEFALAAPAVIWGTAKIISKFDPSKIASFDFNSLGQIGGIGAVCFAVGAILFGLSGTPEAWRPFLRKTIGRPLSAVMSQNSIEKGFVFGKSQKLKDENPQVIFKSDRLGEYTKADLKIWGYEIGINALFYPAIGAVLGLSPLEMLPSALFSVIATIGTGRMSKIWGADNRPYWWVILGRMAVFSSMNAIVPMAPRLNQAGILPLAAGYAIQVGIIAAIAG